MSAGPDQRKSQLSAERNNKGWCFQKRGKLIYSKADVVIVVRFVNLRCLCEVIVKG